MARAVGGVGVKAAAHFLVRERSVNPEYLIWASQRGREDVGVCGRVFPRCSREGKGVFFLSLYFALFSLSRSPSVTLSPT